MPNPNGRPASIERHRRVVGVAAACVLLAAAAAAPASAQVVRSMAQDPALNNLRLPPGAVTGATDTFGRIRTVGRGPKPMVLIPGLGFGDEVWDAFMARHEADYTMYAVTLPGFGGTPPLPMPPDTASYAATPWFTSSVRALEALLERLRPETVTLVAHWVFASQVALQAALDHPDRVRAVVLVGGVLKAYYDNTPAMLTWSHDERVRYADAMAQKWFRTVTRRTWDDNNFMPFDYAVDPLRGLFLWREAQAPILPVWVRYLLEFYSLDPTPRLAGLRVPTLVVQPGFDDSGFYVDGNRNYMRSLCHGSWDGARDRTDRLTFERIPGARLFVMVDQPDALDAAMGRFLAGVDGARGLP